MKNLILDIKYYLILLCLLIPALFLYLDYQNSLEGYKFAEVIKENSYRDEVKIPTIETEQSQNFEKINKIIVNKNDTLINLLESLLIEWNQLL